MTARIGISIAMFRKIIVIARLWGFQILDQNLTNFLKKAKFLKNKDGLYEAKFTVKKQALKEPQKLTLMFILQEEPCIAVMWTEIRLETTEKHDDVFIMKETREAHYEGHISYQ